MLAMKKAPLLAVETIIGDHLVTLQKGSKKATEVAWTIERMLAGDIATCHAS